jgi:hypothetical protein
MTYKEVEETDGYDPIWYAMMGHMHSVEIITPCNINGEMINKQKYKIHHIKIESSNTMQ